MDRPPEVMARKEQDMSHFLRSAIKCAICLRWPQARMYFLLWRAATKGTR